MKNEPLALRIKRLEALLEYESSNKLHRKIGWDKWQIYRPNVPSHIPDKQAALYIFKLIKKERKGTMWMRKWFRFYVITGVLGLIFTNALLGLETEFTTSKLALIFLCVFVLMGNLFWHGHAVGKEKNESRPSD